MNYNRNRSPRRTLGLLATVALLGSTLALAATVSPAAAATDVHLCAKAGTATVDDPTVAGNPTTSFDFYGFVTVASEVECMTSAVPTYGDPTPIRLIDGDPTTVHLYNQTSFSINFSAIGLTGAPDLGGVPAGGSDTYTFTPDHPGTYLYESNLDPRHSLVGLTGVMVVDSAVAGTAHGTAASQYDKEQVVLLSEVDPAFNATFPGSSDLSDYKPSLYLINGHTFTEAGSSGPTPLTANANEEVLLRYVNTGSTNSSMTVLGVRQSIVAFDGENQLGDGSSEEDPLDHSQVFVTAGQTADAIVTVAGDPGDTLSIYNRNLRTSATGDNGAQLMQIVVGTDIIPAINDIYFSAAPSTRTYLGVSVGDADVAVYNGTTVDIHFDGDLHGLDDTGSQADINAVHVDPLTGDVYFSLRYDYAKPTGGTVGVEWAGVPDSILQENDVYKWDGTVFSKWLDGDAIGLDDNRGRHDINALHVFPTTGITAFSTSGSIQTSDHVPLSTGSTTWIGARNEDVLRWVPVFGAANPSGAGSFESVADFSDIGMAAENTDGLYLSGSDIRISLTSNFVEGLVTFDHDDLIGCLGHAPAAPGSILESCSGALSLELDADDLHAGGNAGQIDAYSIG